MATLRVSAVQVGTPNGSFPTNCNVHGRDLDRLTSGPAVRCAEILLKKSENDLARNSRICPARGVEDAVWPREPMTLVAETDQ
jgi:hypothetical protein